MQFAVPWPQFLENPMHEAPDVQRRSDGSIDFDFYRARATALRHQALRDAATLPIGSASTLVMAGGLGFAVALPSTGAVVRDQVAAVWTNSSHTR
jgi:hypothetical protein